MSIVEHRVLGDHRGQLIAIEGARDIPFEIKRIFYIYGAQPNTLRGQHAHHKTRQYLIAVSGSCNVTLDDGKQRITYSLHQPDIGLLQEPLVWGTMHDFSHDCVLVVLASEHYEENDYIRNYAHFQEMFK
ncbi:FdtA/QdtA family cupin domain-containing protein [Halopseudomonas aestusnigri]|jgi:dTDP-4-dehydrorhamnose 3,5-epimerase-like enzyme|uniref:sugar 3,4-ketoisomerase n=1 Tax=Halopseudomonas aestusnigri TaxID=857252 RepID=UPI001E31ED9D|nr:FdtA/QdtA family cupin domain-containing protein [Halopseudomonas aestusnigri]UGV31505.1 FdtA/QdtA family cupin domain-containing protein [Halopseudomonas aestusnigri]